MSDIKELQLLIQKEQQRSDEMEEQIKNESRLLEEAEDQKRTIMRKMLQDQLEQLKEKNMRKDQKLIEIKKWKASSLEEVHELHEKFAASVSFLFYFVFSDIFSEIYKCLYV